MFVWVFHRISGVLLIFLLAVQIFTGFYQASASSQEFVQIMASLHKHTVLNVLMVFLLIFHALYGIRTILMDLGFGREKLLFWICNILGLSLFSVFLFFFLTMVAA